MAGVLLCARPGGAQPANRLFAPVAGIPVARDLDGDGKTDIVIYRAGKWRVLTSGSNSTTSSSDFTTYSTYTWSLPGDVPAFQKP